MKHQSLLYRKECSAVGQWLSQGTSSCMTLCGLVGSSAAVFSASIVEWMPGVALFVFNDEEEAAYFYNDLRTLTSSRADCDVLFYPTPFRRASRHGTRDTANVILRTEVLSRLAGAEASENARLLIVTFPEALAPAVPSQQQTANAQLTVCKGDTVEQKELSDKLDKLGFQEVDYVYEPGQYAQRGSIVDIFSFASEYPQRIDFFGNEVDSIRTFDVQSQLSREQLQRALIAAAEDKSDVRQQPFMNVLPADSLLIARDIDYIARRVAAEIGILKSDSATALHSSENHWGDNADEIAASLTTFRRLMLQQGSANSSTGSTRQRKKDDCEVQCFHTEAQPLFHKNMSLLRDTLADYIHQRHYRLILLAESSKQINRIGEIINGEGTADEKPFDFRAMEMTLHEGYIDHDRKLCIFTDHQIFDRYHRFSMRSDIARQGKMAVTLREIQEMDIGDYLVHIDFGIGKFGGLVRVPTQDAYQEMIRIVYQRGDTVDVSIHNLYKISKYRRSDTGEPPRLSTIGTGAWERLKQRTKQRMKDIARDLIRLYAQRRRQTGHAFAADTFMQQELEASFIYEDTPDQLSATADVKADMERARPMDRLICGDVGFGKTEVAVRAAFKAAADGKQVAVLVPTTVLCLQHYQTFAERLKDMPVRVDYLSRARTPKQTKAILDDLSKGKIDILVGTHKITGKQVVWKDLGLLIIDEEQKFGVAVKERLRTLRTDVDTLTLTATPIPRTLQFSLMGARDMSVMRTPPPNRYPIFTELITFDTATIADAIRDEMGRNGQVFFVSNRINGLEDIARTIHRNVPEARLVIAHGQMPPTQMEEIIMAFVRHEFDVLLSTTIIENGIDIPNANTIIINHAHQFGLSDLHQMRGRVGRTNRHAYCYLIAPPKDLLPADTRRRLEALETFSELGSGFNIALQDLDLRGAGNLLGAEQSGFIEDLGYDTYQKILTQAMRELREEEAMHGSDEEMEKHSAVGGNDIVDDCTIESDLAMYLPDNYVAGSSERLLLYRELQNLKTDQDVASYRQRLEDRFGSIPREGEQLMNVVALRRLGKKLGCEKIVLKQGHMHLQFVSHLESPYYQSRLFGQVILYATTNVRRCLLREVNGRRMMTLNDIADTDTAISILQAILDSDAA